MNETTKEALDNLWMHIYEDIDHCLAPHLMNDIPHHRRAEEFNKSQGDYECAK